MKLRDGELALMRSMVLKLAGVHLDDSKGYLIEARLGPIAEKHGCANFNELYFRLRHGDDKTLTEAVVDAITTHETNWFRDGAPFDALQFKVLPEVIDARAAKGAPRTLRIWSAACSTGQEPYGIAMVLSEMIPDIERWDVQILATDISASTVATAERGQYSEHDLGRTLRPAAMSRWFESRPGGAVVKPAVRRLVTFRQRNLVDDFHGLGPFDVVFLRNVLIYFDATTRQQIVDRMARVLLPHGWLFLGASENLVSAGFQEETHCRAVVYRPRATARV